MMNATSPVSVSMTLPILLVIVAGFVLAGMDAQAKLLAGLSAPVLMILWGRYFFHAIITFVAYAGASRSLGFLKANRPGLQFFRASALFAATTSFYIAITRMPLGDAASIQFLAPVLVTAFSGLFLGEKVGPRRWSAVVCAFVGVLIVARPGSGIFGWWALLPLVTAFLLATYMIMTRTIRDKDRPDVTTFYTTAVGAVVLTFIMPVVWAPLSPIGWALMIGMGVAGAIGHYCLVRAFHAAEASALAPFTYAHVVAAIIYSFVIFKDVPSIWTLTGADRRQRNLCLVSGNHDCTDGAAALNNHHGTTHPETF